MIRFTLHQSKVTSRKSKAIGAKTFRLFDFGLWAETSTGGFYA